MQGPRLKQPKHNRTEKLTLTNTSFFFFLQIKTNRINFGGTCVIFYHYYVASDQS